MNKHPTLYPAVVFSIPNGVSYRLIHLRRFDSDPSDCAFVPDTLEYAQIVYELWAAKAMYITYIPISISKTENEKFLDLFFDSCSPHQTDLDLTNYQNFTIGNLSIQDSYTKIVVSEIIESIIKNFSSSANLKKCFKIELDKLQNVKLGRKTYLIFENFPYYRDNRYTWIGRTNWNLKL